MHHFHKTIVLLFFTLVNISSSVAANVQHDFPAATTELTIKSHGKRMSGFIYHPIGEGPHPTVLLLHGYPGNEKNLDVAQSLRANGWNVVFFHYRGAWGSEGEFSFINAEQDVQVVLQYLNDEKNAAKLRINRDSLSIVGHSMGGHMALAGFLDNSTLDCAVTYDGANMGVADVGIIEDKETAIPWFSYSDSLFMLNGWSGEKAAKELNMHAKKLNLVRRVDSVKGRPVLVIAADTDVIPMKSHVLPLLKALRATKNSNVSYKLIDDDHSFNSSRDELIQTTINFLNKHCRLTI